MPMCRLHQNLADERYHADSAVPDKFYLASRQGRL